MVYEFINFHRKELIKRCKGKVASRFRPSAIPPALEHGVPLLLEQLVDMLRIEELGLSQSAIASEVHLSSAEIGRTAAIHGAELLRQGFAIEQVVREYDDVCQAIAEMAIEANAEISSDEFRTLNRCLDDAIADAVKSFGNSRQKIVDEESAELASAPPSFPGGAPQAGRYRAPCLHGDPNRQCCVDRGDRHFAAPHDFSAKPPSRSHRAANLPLGIGVPRANVAVTRSALA